MARSTPGYLVLRLATTRGSLRNWVEEMQKYFFKIGPVELTDGNLLAEIVDFFEEGVAAGKGVLELIGNDVAPFCDDLIKDSRTYADIYQESITGKPTTAED
ncbi:DUF1048 domain-containing protein [Kribbella sp. NPDC050241]|uniref:DUF1048 domain-containing protein n=1 Tax=Kribbella sp. NPDC050241 TaxID=3364115 RepID=UPI0037B77B41